MGFDEPAENLSWAEAQEYPFELWTDDDKTLALYYGAVESDSAATPSRVTRVLDADGVLVLEYDIVSVSSHAATVLADCELLFGN